jgi:hypothetical protein
MVQSLHGFAPFPIEGLSPNLPGLQVWQLACRAFLVFAAQSPLAVSFAAADRLDQAGAGGQQYHHRQREESLHGELPRRLM